MRRHAKVPSAKSTTRLAARPSAVALSVVAVVFFALATSASAACPNEAIRLAQHTAYLPDCRAVELVNSPDKGNQHLEIGSKSRAYTADGRRAFWSVLGGAPGASSGTYNSFVATRGPTGWTSKTPIPPVSQQVGGGTLKYIPVAATADLSRFIYMTEEPGLAGGNPAATYVRLGFDQSQDILQHLADNHGADLNKVDTTADLSHVLHVNFNLSPRVIEDIGSGTPEIVSYMPDGSLPSCGILPSKGFVTGGNRPHLYPDSHWIATTDASRVYFQANAAGQCGTLKPSGLYVRIREGIDETIKLASDAAFIRATPDGKTGYFTTPEALSAADENSNQDVYQWTEGVGFTCLTCVVPDARLATQGKEARRVLVSNDFSYVYFTSNNELIPGKGSAGAANLYALVNGTLHFVASTTEVGSLLSDGEVYLSADGNVLTFRTSAKVTGDNIAEGDLLQVYRYDNRDGSLVCVSCVQGGMTTGGVEVTRGEASAMSEDGSTIAFSTPQALLPSDVNGGQDIYSWRNGAVGLITDGVTEFGSEFAAPFVSGINADGTDIFFKVTSPDLTGFEQDGTDNLYDARMGGGFEIPALPLHCAEESCQGPLLAPPAFERPASSGFVGRGNLSGSGRETCGAHKVRRHGRCVSRRHKRIHKKHSGKVRAKQNAGRGK